MSDFEQRLGQTTRIVEDTVKAHGLPLSIVRGETTPDRRVIFDLPMPDAPLSQAIAQATGAGGCVIRLQVELLPPKEAHG